MVSDAMVVEAPKKGSNGHSERIPVLTKRKARNLYLFEDATYQRIADECGLSLFAAQKLISRMDLPKQRKLRESRLVKKQDARMSGIDDEVIEAIASASEQHAIRGLQRVGEALERNDKDAAKDFQALTAGVKNLATTARAMREPVAGSLESQGPGITNFFFVGSGMPQGASEPKPVTEAETRPAS